MAFEPSDWLDRAFEIYRAGRIELEKWRALLPHDVRLDYCIEELKDELLELKEATFAEDPGRALQSVAEVMFLLVELQNYSEGNE